MASFQSNAIIFFAVLLVVCLIAVGYMMYKKQTKAAWPPLVGECPDYWLDLSTNGSKCSNTKNLGTCTNNKMMDFTLAPYNGSDSACQKYAWATSCGVTWDGITSGVINPCDPSGNIV